MQFALLFIDVVMLYTPPVCTYTRDFFAMKEASKTRRTLRAIAHCTPTFCVSGFSKSREAKCIARLCVILNCQW